jgi:protein SCO1/2
MKREVLVTACLLALAPACNDRADVSTTRATAAANAEVPSASIYPLDIGLRDQDDQAIRLDVFRGHPTIVSMFYGSCPVACPLIVAHVKEIEAGLSPEVRDATRVLLVSFDPEHDTPAALREMAARHRVDVTRWRFATGSEDDVRVLAAALRISYRKLPGGGFTHDSVISVLDRDGGVVSRVDDPRAELTPLSASVTRIAMLPK